MHPTHKPAHQQPTGPETTPADVLRGAAVYLDRHGWHQGAMYASLVNPTPPACLVGAIRMAACGGTQVTYTDASAILADQAVYELATHLHRPGLFGDGDEIVCTFNDRPVTTKADAIAALHAAADQWDTTHRDTPEEHTGGAA